MTRPTQTFYLDKKARPVLIIDYFQDSAKIVCPYIIKVRFGPVLNYFSKLRRAWYRYNFKTKIVLRKTIVK